MRTALSICLAVVVGCGARTTLEDPDSDPGSGGGAGEGGSTPTCFPLGDPCVSDVACCSGSCQGSCVEQPPPCSTDQGPVVLAEGLTDPYAMAIGPDHAFIGTLAEDAQLLRVSKRGGPTDVLSSDVSYVDYLVYRDDLLFFTEGVGSVNSMRPDGSDLQRLASGAGPAGLAVDDTHVYFTDYFGDTVESIDRATLEQTVWASGQSSPYRVAVGGGWIFFTSFLEGLHTIWMPNGTQGALGSETVRSVAVVGDHVYWGIGTDSSRLMRASLSTSIVETFADFSAWGHSIESIAANAAHIYVSLQGFGDASGAIARVPQNGGTPELVSPALSRALAQVAVDDHCVYWTERGQVLGNDGKLVRARIP